ncbi:MAG: efflux RND transporter periplasmic adaptor subunit, partial [Proteobacteria bacterium]|nr:efflux RND transporter periplasmic adaptor subunit [Pseudomonadota bacterium]
MKFLRDRAEAKRPYTPLASLPSATNFYMRFARWRWGGTLTAYLFVSLAIGLAVAGCALAFGTAPASWAAGGTAPTPTATCPGPGCQTLPVALVVRGVVRPLAQSAVGSLTGGTVRLSRIVVGDRVGNGQALARVEPG